MNNPLLELGHDIPFDRIRADHVEPAVEHLLAEARDRIDAIGAVPGPRTYDNTLGPFDSSTQALENAAAVIGLLEAVATTPELRKAYNAARPRIAELYSSIPLNAPLYRALRELAETDEAKTFSPVRRRFLDKTIDELRRHGADLDAAGKKRLESIDVELTTVTTRFAQNVLDSTNAFELLLGEERQLVGLPPSARDAARQSARDKGQDGWRFTLQAPSYLAVMTYLADPVIRQRMWRAYSVRATSGDHDNRPLIRRILELRLEKARLLGYESFVDFVLADRMAGNAARARRFVDELRERTERFFAKETDELLAFRRDVEGPSAPVLEPWDIAYYAEQQRRALYDFDGEELRPYFPVEGVVRGFFEIARRLYGVSILLRPDAASWDRDVSAFDLVEADGSSSGTFYVDLHPRENKRGGAWMTPLRTEIPPAPQLGLICANASPPVDGKQALLTHREVETIFHELGHLMHHLSSRVEVRSLAGIRVAWDFVELPSQIMENWCWEREALDLIACHHQTGEPIPEDLSAKMRRARTYRAGAAQMRQLGFAAVDFALHLDFRPDSDDDPMELARSVMQPYSPAPLPDDFALIAGFTHLFADPVGYAGAYYSYKWAEVLDADAFSRFREAGIFDAKAGAAFRDCVLSRGDSADPMDLFRELMGREPSVAPLMERLGLV